MKKIILAAVLVFGIFLCLSSANAALLGVDLLFPDILSNQAGYYTYTWDSGLQEGLFISRAIPLTLTDNGMDLSYITGDASYEVSFWLDGDGNFLRGLGSERNDLVITGEVEGFSGALLTGKVTDFGWATVPGTSIALFDFYFNVTGGALAEYFGSFGGDLATAEKSSFIGDWQVKHGGIKVKHDTAAVVPIPGAVWLLGTGFIALVTLRRKKSGWSA